MVKSSIVSAVLAGSVLAGPLWAQSTPSPHDDDPNRITISCYRGPLETVAWDRPNSVFIDDLMQLGYDRTEATMIGEQVCRDEFGVRNPAHQVEQIREILRNDPPR